VQNIGKELPK